MKIFCFVSLILIFSSFNLFAQAQTDQDMDAAFQNAKKGIYWALSNIPVKKSTVDNDLIGENKLYASVKLSKEINGVKVVSKGYYQTNEVVITIYKSYDSLKTEGYDVPGGS
jgi:hypothetical protein